MSAMDHYTFVAILTYGDIFEVRLIERFAGAVRNTGRPLGS
jgi:hypothetical protein